MKKSILCLILAASMLLGGRSSINAAGDIKNFEGEIKTILKTVSPSIVKVISENHKRYFATGIAIDKDLVISNRKVVPLHYNFIYIKTTDGRQYSAKILASDHYSSVLLLKIKEKVLTPIRQAKSSEVGDWVALVGAFYRKFPAIYHGFVSSASEDELLVNAPVAPGASGGAIVNKKGELVGVIRGRFKYAERPDYTYVGPEGEWIVRSSRSQHKELCYALPTNIVSGISDDLLKYGKVKRGWLGVALSIAHNGIVVSGVTPDSPASKAGIRNGDLLLKINEKKIRKIEDVSRLMHTLKPGQSAKIQLQRNQLNKSVIAVIGELKDIRMKYDFKVAPEMPEKLPQVENYVFSLVGAPSLGVDAVSLSPELAKEFKVKEGSGLMISRIYEDAAAKKAGLQVSDVIVKVGDQSIQKNSDLLKALAQLDENEAAEITVYRKGKLLKVTATPTREQRFGPIFNRFSDKINDFHIRVDQNKWDATREFQEEERTQTSVSTPKTPKEPATPKDAKDQDELKHYKEKIEKMQKEQDKLKKDMKRLMKLLEEKEKKQNKTDNQKDQIQ